MYINKIVFQEADKFTREEYNKLINENVICYTDYNTIEILSSKVQELQELNDKEKLKILNDKLGIDIVNLLLKDEIDFVLIV